jgi:hypothetical protein
MTAGVKSGKAQNERMFFRFTPQSGHRELAPICPFNADFVAEVAEEESGRWRRATRP